jgi:DNA-binding CsgD family transcriptional regulator
VARANGGPPPIVGRDGELSDLLTRLQAVASGQGAVVLVRGEAGIGKTRLLQELTRRCHELGFRVLAGAADQLLQDEAFAAIGSALEADAEPDAGREALARALRAGGEQHLVLLDRLLSLVERLAMRRPVLLCVDDLHWADVSSLAALDHVARGCGSLPVAVAVGLRPAALGPAGRGFVRRAEHAGAVTLDLGPLDGGAVAALVAQVAGGRPGGRLLEHVAGAAGSPLYVRELVRALVAAGRICRVAGDAGSTVELVAGVLPTSFRRLVLERVADLPAATVDAARLAATLGVSFTVADLAEAYGRPAPALLEALAPAVGDGLLVARGDDLAFRHQLVRDVVYEDIPSGMRAALHLHAGRRLAAAGAPPVTVAAQLALGGEAGRRQAVSWLARAAAESMARAPDASAEHLSRAIELVDPRHPDRERLLTERAVALVWAGRPADAAAACRELLPSLRDGPREIAVRHTLAHACLLLGRGAEAAAEAERIALGGGDGAALALGDAAMGRVLAGELRRGGELAGQAIARATVLGHELALSLAYGARSLVSYFEGRLPDALEMARKSSSLALRVHDPEARVRPTALALWLCLADAERYEEAAVEMRRSRDTGDRAGATWHAPLLHNVAGRMAWLAGEWDDCAAEMETSIAVGADLGIRWVTGQQLSKLAVIAVHRDDLRRCEELLGRADREFAEGGPQFGLDVMIWARGLWHEARGELPRAVELLGAGWAGLVATGYLSQCLALGPDLVRLAVAAGDRALAAGACDVLDDLAGRMRLASAAGMALRCRGLVEDSPDLLLQAVAVLREGRRPVELAAACEDAGHALAGRGRPEAGVPLLDEAVATYRRVGARRDVARALARLRGHGVHRRGSIVPGRPATGWAALTQTERRVAELAVQGLTNPEIGRRLYVSRRTVDTHMSHVLGKLGLSSRVELAAAHARAGKDR